MSVIFFNKIEVNKEAKNQDQIFLQKRSEYTQAVPINSLRGNINFI